MTTKIVTAGKNKGKVRLDSLTPGDVFVPDHNDHKYMFVGTKLMGGDACSVNGRILVLALSKFADIGVQGYYPGAAGDLVTILDATLEIQDA